MYAERHVVTLTTDASGAVTGHTPVVAGEIRQIVYVPDGSTPFDATVDFTITLEATGEGLWVESNITGAKSVAPRLPTHDLVGAAALYAAGGVAVRDRIAAAKDRVKIVIAQGGDTKKGTFHVVIA